MSALKPKMMKPMKMTRGTILATVAMELSAAASLTPRKIKMWVSQRMIEAPSSAGIVVPSPKMGKNAPRVDLIRSRQATSARQQPTQ